MTSHILTKETIASKTCVGLLHRGPYSQIGDTFKKFFASMNGGGGNKPEESNGDNNKCGASTMDGKVLGLYLDDPQRTTPDNLRSYAALQIAKTASVDDFPKDFAKVEAPGGTAAVLTVTGSYSELGDAWQGFEKRIKDEGWKISTNPNHISQEVYVTMDMKDQAKSVTQLVLFLEE
ncbi:MAG: hypothetical protein SGILL_007912 [Bacillariaceae sp.]